jgi:hypothetical protein
MLLTPAGRQVVSRAPLREVCIRIVAPCTSPTMPRLSIAIIALREFEVQSVPGVASLGWGKTASLSSSSCCIHLMADVVLIWSVEVCL